MDNSYNIGDIVYIVEDYKIDCNFLKGEILKKNKEEVTVNLITNGKSGGQKNYYINQSNITILKNKKKARMVFLSFFLKQGLLHKKYNKIKEKIGAESKEKLEKEIEESQDQFPELWI